MPSGEHAGANRRNIIMVEIISGEKGKGKTRYLLEFVNSAIKEATGNIVYLDKSTKNSRELSNKVRLINVSDYPVSNSDEFIGFICGIISQDYDLQEVYLDSFLTIARISDESLVHCIEKLDAISEKYNIKFVLSVSRNEADLPDSVKAKIKVSL